MAPPERALLRSAEAFAVMLNPPGAPSLCPVCFSQFCAEVDEKDGAEVCLQMKCHAFWDAVVRFISEQWTPSAEAAATTLLKQKHRECRLCTVADAGIADASMFVVVYSAACRALSCALDNRFKVQTKGFGDRLGRWPTSADQLFPYGAERAISSLTNHIILAKDALPAIFSLVVVHRPLVFPLLMRDECRFRVLTAVVMLLYKGISVAHADLAKLPQPSLPPVRDATVRANAAIRGAMAILHVLAFGQGAALSDHRCLTRSWEAPLFAVMDAMLRLFAGPEYMENWAMHLVRYLWRALPEQQQRVFGYSGEPPYIAAVNPELAALAERNRDDPYAGLHYFLKRRAQLTQHACGAPNCTASVHDKATPGAFARCGRCRFVQYCSRSCQRGAWTDPEHPHKAICDMLHELFTSATLEMEMEQFARVCRDSGFPLERADALTQWAATHIMYHDAIYASVAPVRQHV